MDNIAVSGIVDKSGYGLVFGPIMSDLLLTGTNAEYHANRTHMSSSALKLLLKSPEQYHRQYVLGEPQEVKDHFTEGSFVHALILEPHLVTQQFAMFQGLRKVGRAYEQFRTANAGKQILSAPQVHRCERLAEAYSRMSTANMLLADTLREHGMQSSMLNVPIKARADAILPGQYIVDVKTTSMPSGIDFFKLTLKEYMYDLSASLYCQIAHDTYGKLHDFYWIVLSKADYRCEIYKASSLTLSEGAAKVIQGLVLYKKCLEAGKWEFPGRVEPASGTDYEILDV